MTNKEILEKFRNGDITGYWSEYYGVEVVEIEQGIEDKCLCVSNTQSDNPKVHKLKIHYKNDESYIVLHGRRLSFSDCLRKNI